MRRTIHFTGEILCKVSIGYELRVISPKDFVTVRIEDMVLNREWEKGDVLEFDADVDETTGIMVKPYNLHKIGRVVYEIIREIDAKIAQPIHGEKFIEVPFAVMLTYEQYYDNGTEFVPRSLSELSKVEVQTDTLWAVEKDLRGKVIKYWQYSKTINRNPIGFTPYEVILLDKFGGFIK